MTELGIEEKNILPLLGLDGLPVHIRRKTDYVEPEFVDTCYVECFGHVLAVYHKREEKCYIKELRRLHVNRNGITASQVLCFSGFEADTAMGYHRADKKELARLRHRLGEGLSRFRDSARLSYAMAAYVHANKGVPEDWRQWHAIRDCIAGRFCMAARNISHIAAERDAYKGVVSKSLTDRAGLIRTLDDLMACFSKAVYDISQDNVFPRLYLAYLQSTFGAIFKLERPGLYLSVQTLTGERLADTTCLRTGHDKYVHWTQVSRKDLEEATAYVKSILRIA